MIKEIENMKIECLIGETYQVTDDSTVLFQGSLSDCFVYMCRVYLDQNKEDDMRIECLIGETYQVTDGSTVLFQGSLSDCKAYLS